MGSSYTRMKLSVLVSCLLICICLVAGVKSYHIKDIKRTRCNAAQCFSDLEATGPGNGPSAFCEYLGQKLACFDGCTTVHMANLDAIKQFMEGSYERQCGA